MVMPPRQSSVRKVRTFADDVQRARGAGAQPTSEQNTPQSAVSEFVPKTPAQPQRVAAQPAAAVSPTNGANEELFNIRESARGGGESGTIVQERRKARWSFTDEVARSFKSWLGDTRNSLSRDSGAPMIAPASERASIVKVASLEKSIAPQDDHETLVQKLRTYSQKPPEEIKLKAPQEPEAAPQWSYVDQDGTVGVNQPQTPATPTEPPTRALPPIPPRPQFLTPTAEAVVQPPITTTAPAQPEPALPESPVVAEDTSTYATAAEAEPVVYVPVPRDSVIPREKTFTEIARERALARRELEARERVTPIVSSHITLYVGAAAFVLLTLGGIATAGYLAVTRTESNTTTAESRASFIIKGITEREAIALQNDRTALLIELTKRSQEVKGSLGALHEFYFVYPNDSDEEELPPEAFFATLEAQAPGSLIRAISSLVVGTRISSFNAPFIVLRVRDRNEALGGMLEWEPYINSDLAPFFGEDVARTGGTLGRFTDTTIRGNDARVLKDQGGNTILAYAFVGNLVILSTSEDTIYAMTE